MVMFRRTRAETFSALCVGVNSFNTHPKEDSMATKAELIDAVADAAGVPRNLRGCHTAKIAGYVIEGDVPAEDIRRLLAERPDAVGLSVPGMPVGSPGMEQGSRVDRYVVVLIKRDGRHEVWSRNGGA